MGNRVTLKDIGKHELNLAGKIIKFDKNDVWVGNGGTCLVYNAWILLKEENGKEINRRIILKEFYPVLTSDNTVSIQREADGSIHVPEVIVNNKEYKEKLTRFKNSYTLFTQLHNHPILNNHVVTAEEMIEENGTVYLIIDYDEAESLFDVMKKDISLYEFLKYLRKSSEILGELHTLFNKEKALKAVLMNKDEENKEDDIGYFHLDVTPGNFLCFDAGNVKFIDTDSLLSREDILEEKQLSRSSGYAAPELFSDYGVYRKIYRNGEQADIFSIGAILFEYIYGSLIDIEDKDNQHIYKTEKGMLTEEFIKDFRNLIWKKYSHCPRYGLILLEELFTKTLAENPKDRYESMKEVSKVIDKILYFVEPKKVRIIDNYMPNNITVHGRKNKIADIEKGFSSQRDRGSRIVCITGVGGIGKSTLAREYARIHEHEYETIVEVSAGSAVGAVFSIGILNENEDVYIRERRTDVNGGFNRLFGVSEDMMNSKNKNDEYLEIKLSHLMNLCRETKTLLIVHDYNEDEDESFDVFNKLGCDIILTSWNDWADADVECVSLKSGDLSEEAGSAERIFEDAYLINAKDSGDEKWENRLKEILREEKEAVSGIVKKVDLHPLCIKLLAKQSANTCGLETRPGEIFKEINSAGIERHKESKIKNVKDGGNVKFGDAFYHLEFIFGNAVKSGKLDKDEKELLRYMILVPSTSGISLTRFMDWTGKDRKEVQVLASLYKKGWLEYKADGVDLLDESDNGAFGTYHMPMAMQEVLYRQKGMESTVGNSERFVEKCIDVMEDYYIGSLRQIRVVLEQAVCCCRYLKEEESGLYIKILRILRKKETGFPRKSRLYIKLLVRSGAILAERGGILEEHECLGYSEKVLEIERKVLGEEHEGTAVSYDSVGRCYWKLGNREKGLEYSEKALEIRRKVLGEEHEDTAESYHNVGYFYWDLGNKEKGLEYGEKALEIRRKVLGEERIATSRSYDFVGTYYCELGNREKGLEYREKALEIMGEEYVDAPESHVNIGFYYADINDFEKAIIHFQKAYDIHQKNYFMRELLWGEECELTQEKNRLEALSLVIDNLLMRLPQNQRTD